MRMLAAELFGAQHPRGAAHVVIVAVIVIVALVVLGVKRLRAKRPSAAAERQSDFQDGAASNQRSAEDQ
jgi:Tfp pilus assembly protein PilX